MAGKVATRISGFITLDWLTRLAEIVMNADAQKIGAGFTASAAGILGSHPAEDINGP